MIKHVTMRSALIHARTEQHSAAVEQNVYHRDIVPTAFVLQVRKVTLLYHALLAFVNTTRIVPTMKHVID